MPHNPTLARIGHKAAEQGYVLRDLTEGVFTLRECVGGWPRLVTRIMRWEKGKLHAFEKLEEIEAWLDRGPAPDVASR
jgi:hypothetical protein